MLSTEINTVPPAFYRGGIWTCGIYTHGSSILEVSTCETKELSDVPKDMPEICDIGGVNPSFLKAEP